MIKTSSFDLSDRSKWVAVIGSRNCSEKERKAAFEFSYDLAQQGYVVVSGLARGIDTAAHQGALMTGKTVAILSTTGSEKIYPPENESLSKDITKNGTLVHLYNMNPHLIKEKGFSQFQKRLIERDAVLAWACDKIVAVKDGNDPIDGGTRYACNYGYKMDKSIYRLDSNLKLHKSPDIKSGKVWWEPEIDMDKVERFFNYKLEGEYTENEGFYKNK